MSNKNISYDGEIIISIGKSRKDTKYAVKPVKWSKFLQKVSSTKYTKETLEEFLNMSKETQNEIKDIGGFVGGELIDGVRRNTNIKSRSLITLDADYGTEDFLNIVRKNFNYNCCIYSTHKHSTNTPRFRVVIPLSKEVTPVEYEYISKIIANQIGIKYFDESTFEAARLMYWPSTTRNGEFVFQYEDKEWLNPDDILNNEELISVEFLHLEEDINEDSTLTQAVKEFELDNKINNEVKNENTKVTILDVQPSKKNLRKKEDPREKEGIIGAFCRAYNIHEAIETFLSDKYFRSKNNHDRYTYKDASTANGLILYDDGLFAYSHHDTDKAKQKLLNAYDLVRIQLFCGNDDDKALIKASFTSMNNLIKDDEKVIRELSKKTYEVSKQDFKSRVIDDEKWMDKLERNKTGEYKSSLVNIELILRCDENLKGKIAYNEFSNRIMILENLPWRNIINLREGEIWEDSDDASLRLYLEKVYKITAPNKIMDGILIVSKANSYHPVVKYLVSQNWDGIKRVDTLLIDYFGAKDCEYTRAVARKTLVAAVARVFEPGVKFDNMLVLVGEQGKGKSEFINKLARDWYSDSLTTVIGKEGYEQLQEAWIIEIAELAGISRAEVDTVKHFISKKTDIYREAYGRRTKKFPRQSIFIGTTNNEEFLRDKTGNRRFWPVKINSKKAKKSIWSDLTEYEINNIWAEARILWQNNEDIYLSGELEEQAIEVQEIHTENNAKEGMIEEYLEMLLPERWDSMDIEERRSYIHNSYEFGDVKRDVIKREKVCAMEVWVELFNGDPKMFFNSNAREINDALRKCKGWEPYLNGKQLRFGRFYGRQRAFVRSDSLLAKDEAS